MVGLVFQWGQDSGFLVEWTAMFSFRQEATPSVVSPTNRSAKYLVELHSPGVKLSKGNSSLWGLHFWDAWAELAGAASPSESAEHQVSTATSFKDPSREMPQIQSL